MGGGVAASNSLSVLTIVTHPASEPPRAASVAFLSSPLLRCLVPTGPTHASPPTPPPHWPTGTLPWPACVGPFGP